MPELEELAPTTETEVQTEPVETPPAEEPPLESPETTPETPVDDNHVETQPDAAAQAAAQDAGMPPALKAALDGLKATDPKLAATLRGAYFADKQWKQEFPGGITEAKELKGMLESYGGKESLDEMKVAHEELDTMADMIRTGDPEMISEISQLNPEAFPSLTEAALETLAKTSPELYAQTASHAFYELRQVSPEAYNHEIARIISSFSNATQMQPNLWMAARLLEKGDGEGAKQIIDQALKYFTDVDGLARTQPEIKKAAPTQADPEIARLRQENQQLQEERFRQAHERESLSVTRQTISREMQNYPRLKSATEDVKRAFMSQVGTELLQRLSPQQKETIESFWESRDLPNLAAFEKATYAKILPAVVRDLSRKWFADAGVKTAKPASTATAKPNGAPLPAGIVRIPAPPSPSEIDYSRTERPMLFKGEAWLKDGRHVAWA